MRNCQSCSLGTFVKPLCVEVALQKTSKKFRAAQGGDFTPKVFKGLDPDSGIIDRIVFVGSDGLVIGAALWARIPSFSATEMRVQTQLTMPATAAAIHFVGAVPVPVDCGPDHLIDPESVQAAITDSTKAIMPTHLIGRTCAMNPIMKIAKDHELIVLEDAAQSLGSTYRGKGAGSFGIASALSFYPAKTLACFGDGGAVLTNCASTAEKVRLLRDHGRDSNGETVMWGMNSRLDNLQAAFLPATGQFVTECE